MKVFIKDQYSKIAWRRIFIISFIWTVFSMQAKNYESSSEAVGYGIGHGGAAIVLLSITGAACTKKEGL